MYDEYAELAMLFRNMPVQRQREFWQIRGNSAEKCAYLLRWGRFEQPRNGRAA